jgi:3-dehydroquinate synthase/2-deoxy-scyllo-inosose synthase
MREGTLRIGTDAIPYRYGADCTDAIAAAIEALRPSSAVLVLDKAAEAHAGPLLERLRIPVRPFLIDPNEEHKRLSLVGSVLDAAVEGGADRASVVLAMGGGLVGNTAGLAASLLFRGVRLVHLPTTPVAAFDAVLSLKQGVNLASGKNLCGAYLAPSLIACDLAWLATMPRSGLLTGVAEMAKNVLAVRPDREGDFLGALASLEQRPIDAFAILFSLGLDAKAPFLQDDPRERGGALVFEYGHTVGHALEAASAGTMGHGEAVAWGMLAAAEASAQLGLLDADGLERHYRLLAHLRLPPARTALGRFDRDALAARLAVDNKRGHLPSPPGVNPMVLLRRLGEPVRGDDGRPLIPVPTETALDAFEKVAATEVM